MYFKNDQERISKRLETFPQEVYVPDDRAMLMRTKASRLKEMVLWVRLESNNVSLSDLTGLEKHELVDLLLQEANQPRWVASQLRNHNFHLEALEQGTCDTHTVQQVKRFIQERIGDQCSICLESYEPLCELTYLPCGHAFHNECVKSWAMSQLETCVKTREWRCPSCPSCRTSLNKTIPPSRFRVEKQTGCKRKRETDV
jgi:hypothetical protein